MNFGLRMLGLGNFDICTSIEEWVRLCEFLLTQKNEAAIRNKSIKEAKSDIQFQFSFKIITP